MSKGFYINVSLKRRCRLSVHTSALFNDIDFMLGLSLLPSPRAHASWHLVYIIAGTQD